MSVSFRFYKHLILRRLPVMLLIFMTCAAVSVTLAVQLPAMYETTARLLMRPQEISEDLATSTVRIAAEEEITLLREQLMTRANLIEIAYDYDVFENSRDMAPDDLVEEMELATSIAVVSGSSPALLEVTFSGRSPVIAANVVNEYVTRITAASVAERTGRAEDTLSFFEQEVERLAAELEIRSARISEFQSANAHALPNDQAFRLQRQSLLQERLAALERELRAAEQARTRTIEVFLRTGLVNDPTNLSPTERRLRALESDLSEALTVFSESSPQVVQLRRQIEQLEEQLAIQTPALGGENTQSDPEEVTDPLLALQLAEIDSDLETLRIEIANTEAELEILEEALNDAPAVQVRLERLQREYENIQLQYDNARQSLAQASIGERLEIGGRGQRITLLEPPAVPSSPASPNRFLIVAAGLAMGTLLAGVFFFLKELMNDAVRRSEDISKALGITPIATIPYLEPTKMRFVRRTSWVMATLLILVGVPGGLWAIDQYYMPLNLLAEHLLDRIGLT